jgi:hypothetical protein
LARVPPDKLIFFTIQKTFWQQFILDPDRPIAWLSKRRIISRMQAPRPRVPGPPGAHIPLDWTRESREAAEHCGPIEFDNFHREYRRCSCRRRRDAIHPHIGTRHEYEISGEQELGFPFGYQANAAHCLNNEKMILQRMLGELGTECKSSTRAIATKFNVSFCPIGTRYRNIRQSTVSGRHLRNAHSFYFVTTAGK